MINGSTGINYSDIEKQHPHIAIDEFGNAVIVWVEGNQIWSSIFKID